MHVSLHLSHRYDAPPAPLCPLQVSQLAESTASKSREAEGLARKLRVANSRWGTAGAQELATALFVSADTDCSHDTFPLLCCGRIWSHTVGVHVY